MSAGGACTPTALRQRSVHGQQSGRLDMTKGARLLLAIIGTLLATGSYLVLIPLDQTAKPWRIQVIMATLRFLPNR